MPRQVSTHAPRVHEERPPSRPGWTATRRFNPRSSRSRGATPPRQLTRHQQTFQPTLLAFTRSDRGQAARELPQRVSTHAPRVHEERRACSCPCWPTTCFNPRSSRSRGATSSTTASRDDDEVVSTHAPRVHEERLRPAPVPDACDSVSTHAPRVHEERRSISVSARASICFNPRSSRSRGATPLQLQAVEPIREVSTHAPRVHEERLPHRYFART